MDRDLYMDDTTGLTYTRPGSELRRAEVRHMLNGFVTKVVEAGTLATTLDQHMPRDVAERLVAARDNLRMNYRIVRIGYNDHLLGRPVREDA